ncbi:nitroreductase/quinone reductase family protein [Nocardioides speluncae]|uniref:nitroreductase/quinone reductase family protein n=1 Tax=Nocardioides speluncae TaxID=2670337 RepID=UPI000D68B36C|nr:nitroreductase/quinone reductase family protein [Nocardioides speluncae]
MKIARAVTTGSLAAIALTWIWWLADPTAPASPAQPLAVTALLTANVVLTTARPSAKRALVAFVQRRAVNPLVRTLFRIGFVPFGFALLETRGRRSGKSRQTPVSNGLVGDTFWVIAEHGAQANYVRNLRADPRVRVKLRRGLRFVWLDGVATVLPDDDPLRRQRLVCGWRPLRWFNAITVRTLGTELLTIRIDLTGHSLDSERDRRRLPQSLHS